MSKLPSIGDSYRARPSCGEAIPKETSFLPALNGRVIWVHPRRRYFVVEFTTLTGKKIREAFGI